MSALVGAVETERSPPTTVPLRHFLVALGFLLAGAAAGVLAPTGGLPGRGGLVHVHLLLAGWVCVTIAGAMTQFVPVWSGVDLHSRRLATVQLWLLAPGLGGFAAALSAGRPDLLLLPGLVVLAGFWTFAYNLARTLRRARPWDRTERHFAAALAFLVAVTATGPVLAAGWLRPLPAALPAHAALRSAHATAAVFGVVLGTILGALSQLVPMFTQAETTAAGESLDRAGSLAFPAGVAALAAGRLLGDPLLARAGGVVAAATILATAAVVAARLRGARAAWTTVHTRYAVAALSLVAWALATLPAWAVRPLSPATTFGAPAATHLLLVGGVGFVVLGTLYHVVPFVVWVHRYSDRLGLESVPAVDDLYDDRLAAADVAATAAGTATLVATEAASLPARVTVVGGSLLTVGFAAAAANLLLVVRRHGEHSVRWLLLGRLAGG